MKKVIVFGSLNMDLTIEADRVPYGGETLPGRNFLSNPGGKGANQAVAVSKAGIRTHLVGSVGADVFGDLLLARVASYGVQCDEVILREGVGTGIAMICRVDGDNRILLSAGANHSLSAADVKEALDRLAEPGDVFLTQMECDYAAACAAIQDAHGRGMYVVVNVAPPRDLPQDVWSCIDLACVNETECAVICGVLPEDDGTLRQALDLLIKRGVGCAVVTLGAGGSAAREGARLYRAPAARVNAVDTTASGDTYLGVLCAAYVNGMPMEDAMRRASAAAGITASRVGAQRAIPTAAEVDTFMREA